MSTIQETSENLLRFCGDQKYATIYADPPWRFQNRTGKVAPEHKRLNRYETMELEAIMALPVLPSVVITDMGLVNGANQTFVPVFADAEA